MAEETVEVKFLHHYTDRRGKTPTDHKPGAKASFPLPMARGLVASKVAEFATKKDEKAATVPPAAG